jgi:lipoprotein-anchoring transpeptidase ErfK/SrfK
MVLYDASMRRPFLCALAALFVVPALTLTSPTPAYAVAGSITSVGGAPSLGAVAEPASAIVAVAGRTGGGAWMATATGEVVALGGAPTLGQVAGQPLNTAIVDLLPTPSGQGYWLLASDGGVFTFGDATFLGAATGKGARPIVAGIASPTGQGYGLVGNDGGVFGFGDFTYFGSMPAVGIRTEITDAVPLASGLGYWLVAADGSNYAFGAAPNVGGLPDRKISARVVSAVRSAQGGGILSLTVEGAVHAFGDAVPTIGITAPAGQRASTLGAPPTGPGAWIATTAGLLPARSGQRGPAVRAIEDKLVSLSFWVGAVDGYYDSNLSQAVMAFQKYSGLPRDGVAGPRTAEALAKAAPVVAKTTSGNVVEVDKARQIMMMVDNGRVTHTFNVSTGSGKPYRERSAKTGRIVTGDAKTPDGRFRIYFERNDGWRESELGKLWRPKYFNGGIAVHGALSVPAYPASHGCVRVTVSAMDFIWNVNLLPKGRSVWVYS